MSISATSFTTYTAKGIRENLANVIHNIDPEDTPFSSNVGKGSTKTTFKEWQQDVLDSKSSTNQQLEGDNITTYPVITPTVRLGNYCEIARKLVSISDTEEVVDKAGRKSEMSYQLALKGSALKLDAEVSMLENKAANGGNATTPRITAGMGAWLKTNVVFGVGGANPSYTTLPNVPRTDGTPAIFIEDNLRTVMQSAYTNGGRPTLLSLGAFNKALVSETFAGIATRTLQMTGVEVTGIVGAVDVYVSDFGKLAIAPNRNQRGRDAWFVTPSGISIDYLRAFKQVELAKTGDAENRMLVVEYLLRVNHEKQHGLVADRTTS